MRHTNPDLSMKNVDISSTENWQGLYFLTAFSSFVICACPICCRLVSSCFTADSCVPLAVYKPSCLRDLDLSCNDLDSGMKTLSKWLTHINCKLEILRLTFILLFIHYYCFEKRNVQKLKHSPGTFMLVFAD